MDRRQERTLGGSIREGSKEFTDGTHVAGQPGITIGHEAQGTQISLEQSRRMASQQGLFKLNGVKQQRTTRGCTCWVSRSVERALGGGENAENGRQLHRCHKLPAKRSWCTQQWPGAGDRGILERRTCWTRLIGLERHGCPGLLLWSPVSAQVPVLPSLSTMYSYSCMGRGELEPREKWVP